MLFATASCARGCGVDGAARRTDHVPTAIGARGAPSVDGVDCPDGLARCQGGTVLASRLAILPRPCRLPEGACTCPWDVAGTCERGCAADGAEVTVDRPRVMAQLCAPPRDAGPFAVSPPPDIPPTSPCDEEELYRCARGEVVDCTLRTTIGACLHGCVAEAASVARGDVRVDREAAFAILCSH
jgi:hypothetical protein